MFLMLLWVASMLPSCASPSIVSMNEGSKLSRPPIEIIAPLMTDDEKHSPKCLLSNDNTTAWCCGKNLKEVPQNLPKHITSLYLSNNSITALPDNILSRYTDLLCLNLTANNLTQLSNLSFNGLSKLRHLDLSRNYISYKTANFPLNVFKPLKKLTNLYLNRNNGDPRGQDLSYPDIPLSELTSLGSLHMDGLKNPYFGSGFGKLRHLSTLDLNGYKKGVCKIYSLKNDTFKNLRNLRELDLTNCYIRGNYLEKGAYLPLTQLRKLILTHNEDIGLQNLHKVFYGLQNAKHLKYLSLHLVVNRYSLGICLENKSLEYFPKSVEYLNVKENNLEAVDRQVTQLLSNVKELDISGNKFVFGTYLEDLPKFSNLVSISSNGGGFTYSLPKIYPYDSCLRAPSQAAGTAPSSCSLYNRHSDERHETPFILKLPPKLNQIEMSYAGLTYILSDFTVDENNVLEKLSLPGNHFPRLNGPIKGFVNLKHLNFSECSIRFINCSFFGTFKSLETLRLDNNLLNLYFQSSASQKLFYSLSNLRLLNLSGNALTFLGKEVFEGLNNVEYLFLQQNKIFAFYVSISHMHQLRLLDLRDNRIKTLHDFTRRSIDKLLNKGVPFRVSLAKTSIACICANIDFLQWMSTSLAFGGGFGDYFCSLPDFTTKRMNNGFNETVDILRRECTPHELLLLIVASSSAVILVMIVTAICYRFRFKLLYLYYMAYLLHKRKRKSQQTQFQYDAFICYADEDVEFVENQLEPALLSRGVRIFLHARDFVAGEYINSNIVKAVSICRKTVVVVTKAMLKSNWCRFEVQMANLESVYTGRKVLIFFLLGTKPQRDENLEVFYNIQSNTYCIYPDVRSGQQQLNQMWAKLVRDIQD